MICSEILLVLVLIVLAWMVYLLMSGNKSNNNLIKNKVTTKEHFDIPKLEPGRLSPDKLLVDNQRKKNIDITPVVTVKPESKLIISTTPEIVNTTNIIENLQSQQIPVINYENFASVSGYGDMTHDAAPFKGATVEDDGKYLTVKYTGLVDGKPGEAVQIEGTDLLTAPLVDNMLYTNSIANVNRNASHDLRGDIPVQFNESYTPFYSSTIYGAPLSQHTMTIGTL